MSISSLISIVSPFVFTAIAIYASLYLTKFSSKVDSKKVLYVWLTISILYNLIPFVAVIVDVLPYASFILPMMIVYAFARYYWKLTINQSIIYSIFYGVLNVVSVVALGFLLAGGIY